MYQIRMLDAAACDLARLDPAVARRILNRIRWLAENLEDIKPDALTGELSGLYKLRIGEHRVVYEILHLDQIGLQPWPTHLASKPLSGEETLSHGSGFLCLSRHWACMPERV